MLGCVTCNNNLVTIGLFKHKFRRFLCQRQILIEKYQTGIPFQKFVTLENSDKKYEILVTDIQKYLNSNGFHWFYPHDLLILIRKDDETLDTFLRFEYAPEQKINMKIFFAKGLEESFNSFVKDLEGLFK